MTAKAFNPCDGKILKTFEELSERQFDMGFAKATAGG
jgi:hypothetical protein